MQKGIVIGLGLTLVLFGSLAVFNLKSAATDDPYDFVWGDAKQINKVFPGGSFTVPGSLIKRNNTVGSISIAIESIRKEVSGGLVDLDPINKAYPGFIIKYYFKDGREIDANNISLNLWPSGQEFSFLSTVKVSGPIDPGRYVIHLTSRALLGNEDKVVDQQSSQYFDVTQQKRITKEKTTRQVPK